MSVRGSIAYVAYPPYENFRSNYGCSPTAVHISSKDLCASPGLFHETDVCFRSAAERWASYWDISLRLSAPLLKFLFLCRLTVSCWASHLLCLFVSYVFHGNHNVSLNGVIRLNYSDSETLWWGFIYPNLDIWKKKKKKKSPVNHTPRALISP